MSMATRKLFAAGALAERESSCDGGCTIENPSGRGEGDFVVPTSMVVSPLLALLFFVGVGVGVFNGLSTVSVSSAPPTVAVANALGNVWAKHKSGMTMEPRHLI